MRDEDNLTIPDAYVDNHGVDVEQVLRDPQHGQVSVRIRHNKFQSSLVQMGKAQAVELYVKLGALLAELDRPAAPVVGSVVRITHTAHADLRGLTGTVEHIMPSGNLQVAVGSECIILAPGSVVAV